LGSVRALCGYPPPRIVCIAVLILFVGVSIVSVMPYLLTHLRGLSCGRTAIAAGVAQRVEYLLFRASPQGPARLGQMKIKL
jgi:hypothetical protein